MTDVTITVDRADAIAAEVGLPADWRAIGFDTPEYMVSDDSLYHVRDDNDQPTGVLKCVWPLAWLPVSAAIRRGDVPPRSRRARFAMTHDAGFDLTLRGD